MERKALPQPLWRVTEFEHMRQNQFILFESMCESARGTILDPTADGHRSCQIDRVRITLNLPRNEEAWGEIQVESLAKSPHQKVVSLKFDQTQYSISR